MSLTVKAATMAVARFALRLARDWAVREGRVRGKWVGGYEREMPVDADVGVQAGYTPGSPCRLVIADAENPRRWIHTESGLEYRADFPLVTDGGSTPPLARNVCKEWADLKPFGRHKDAWYFHDSAYRNAGCWVRQSSDGLWEWMRLTRGQSDAFLYQQLPSSGGKNLEAAGVYHGVRSFAGPAWRRHRRRQAATKDNG